MNDGPILIETPVAERAFADLAAITFDNLRRGQEHQVGDVCACIHKSPVTDRTAFEACSGSERRANAEIADSLS